MEIRNNVTSPNFGMALKINKKLVNQKALEELGSETLQKIQKAGEELQDTKFYHVVIDNPNSAKIEADKDAYFGLFNGEKYQATKHGKQKVNGEIVPDERIIMIDDKNGNTLFGVGRYQFYEEDTPFFNAWGLFGAADSPKDIKLLARVAKILDNVAVEKYNEQLANNAAQEVEKKASQTVAGKLLDLYGD